MKTLRKLLLTAILVCGSMNVYANSSIDCLSEAAYHEARGEGISGMSAVMMVIINRTKFPDTFHKNMCGVIHQKGQFSYLRNKHRKIDKKTKESVDKLAKAIYNSYYLNNITPKGLERFKTALFFSKMKRSREFSFLGREKHHSFYKFK